MKCWNIFCCGFNKKLESNHCEFNNCDEIKDCKFRKIFVEWADYISHYAKYSYTYQKWLNFLKKFGGE